MLTPYREALAGLGRDGRLFLLAVGVAGFWYMGVFLLLANLYLLRLNFDETFVGLFAATGALSSATFGVPAGIIGRRLGERRSMVVGFSLLASGLGLLSLAALLPVAWQAAWLLSCCVVRELGNSLYNVNSNPYLMRLTPAGQRGRVFAARMAVANLAAFAGSGVGGVLPALWVYLGGGSAEDPRAYMAPLLLASLGLVPGVLALAATSRLPATAASREADTGAQPPAPELRREPLRRRAQAVAARRQSADSSPVAARPQSADPSPWAARRARIAAPSGEPAASPAEPTASPATALPASRTPPVRISPPGTGASAPTAALIVLPLVALLYITAVGASVGFFNVLMDRVFDLSPARIGVVLAATQLLTVPVILWMAGSASGPGLARVVVLAAVGVAAGTGLEALATTWWLAGAGYVLMGMLNGVFFAAITVYHQEHVHPDWRPLMSGAFITACALGWALTNFTGGYIVVTYGYAMLFGGAAGACLAGAVVFAIFARHAAR